jgi:hypothetical protein
LFLFLLFFKNLPSSSKVRSSITHILGILHVCNTFLTQYQVSHAPGDEA